MTKKDYEAIASIFSDLVLDKDIMDPYENGYHSALLDAARLLADCMQRDNSRFNRQKFLDACNVE